MIDENADLLRRQILEVVEHQISFEDPPEARSTFERLLREGHSEIDSKKLIGCVVVAEMFEIARHGKPYDHARYLEALEALPTLPE